jgi:hypothetical protein
MAPFGILAPDVDGSRTPGGRKKIGHDSNTGAMPFQRVRINPFTPAWPGVRRATARSRDVPAGHRP